MYYKIVEQFAPQNGEIWLGYLRWRGLNLNRFDSLDGILRPDLFVPKSRMDWDNCVNEDFKLSLITNLGFAQATLGRFDDPFLLGVEIELNEGHAPKDGLLGFDIMERECHVSLVTNCGRDDLIDDHVMPNGLIGDLQRVLLIRDSLRKGSFADAHAEHGEVWAVYGNFQPTASPTSAP
ncbi:MAG: hypothetical protein L3K26_09300 [Candidatus Hydrogenedentes bacterium]|nr:hypothetical protein [Candidatus Hydrogenedentota bacterium]